MGAANAARTAAAEPEVRVFDFYVTLMFLISLVRRWNVYVNAIRILITVRGRWPKLIARLAIRN